MIKTVINPDYTDFSSFIHDIPALFKKEGEVIFEGRNILKRFNVNGTSFIVKSFKKPFFINRLVYISIRSSKACRSYKNGLQLIKKGFLTPTPVAYIECINTGLSDSYYITTELVDAHEMREFWFQPEIGDRYPIVEAFGKFTAELHKKEIFHKDFSSGNILYKKESNGQLSFYLVDINRMKFNQPIKEEEGYKNFRSLWLPDETYRIIASSYAKGMG
ncbi:MAG: lipopolysaccharide kinase InaA family protein, partial [Tannerellaceae bacterium]|nr:lipopolysaccharide kinase InaA family protein [Tannerellaceae bacterium]